MTMRKTKVLNKLLTKDKILTLPIEDIIMSGWDVRQVKESVEELEALSESIKKDGLINPITVTPEGNGKYKIIAGRRRFKACKNAGIRQIPCFVKFETNFTETDLRRITLIENLHRKGLNVMEKAYGIVAIYEAAGYAYHEAIAGVKSIDNWFTNSQRDRSKKPEWTDLMTEQYSIISGERGSQANELRYDKQFIDICRSIGRAPKYQYQLMQLCRLKKKVQKAVTRLELRHDQAILLTRPELVGGKVQKADGTIKEYSSRPNLSIQLANQIKDMKGDDAISQARVWIQSVCDDIDKGYYKPENIKEDDTDDDDDDDTGLFATETVKSPHSHFLALEKDMKKILYNLTGRNITRGEYNYTEDMVTNDKAHNHRLKIIKSLDSDSRPIRNLTMNMRYITLAMQDLYQILEEEQIAIKQKKEMLKE